MLGRSGSHFRHNVVAYLVLGGTALAAKALITGADVQDDSLTGADLLESSLGKVPSAESADKRCPRTSSTASTRAASPASADYASESPLGLSNRRLTALAGPALLLSAALALSSTALAAPGGNRAATITGSFADACRDFTAQSSKDISRVEIHYVDGRVVKDESTTTPDFAIDGSAGDEIDSASVKSGTTTETFTCPRMNSPPTAVLEVKTPEGFCFTWDDGLVACDGRIARTTWTHSSVPALGYGLVSFFCQWPDDQSCVLHEMPCGQLDGYSLCRMTYSFRGTSSTDPEDDIVSWSIDFGDGTSASGDWTTNPPTEVSHEYLIHYCPACHRDPATLTVTDSAGNTDSDAQFVYHDYPE